EYHLLYMFFTLKEYQFFKFQLQDQVLYLIRNYLQLIKDLLIYFMNEIAILLISKGIPLKGFNIFQFIYNLHQVSLGHKSFLFKQFFLTYLYFIRLFTLIVIFIYKFLKILILIKKNNLYSINQICFSFLLQYF
ncbi:hypothetical protein IMG5_141080, partial [Ichthyophthirius multifiliis]